MLHHGNALSAPIILFFFQCLFFRWDLAIVFVKIEFAIKKKKAQTMKKTQESKYNPL
jgi:hypothetical protein